MDRFKNGIRRLVALPGRAWRRLGSSEDGTSKAKFSRVAFIVAAMLVLFIGWRTITTIQKLSSADSLLLGDGDQTTPGVDVTLAQGGSPEDDGQGTPVVHVASPPAPDVPEASKPFHFTDLVRPVSADDFIGPGWRRNPETAFWYYESALVMQAPVGSPVVAAGPGIVTAMTPASGSSGGWNVTIQHDEHFTTVYDNVFDVEVAPGNAVSAHTRLGTVMNRSFRDGLAPATATPSISFAVVHDGEVVDAMAMLPDR